MDPHSFIARAEAQRWLGIAEKLLISHDFVGSKTFAIRARESDPRLEAAEQILAIADTLLAAEKRVVGNNGAHQPDYYAILQLVRFVQDTEHISSQYRRLAVLLNPHQNRFPYSDQAFQLVNDAWAVLSNPMRKSMYDTDLDYPPQQEMNNLGFNLEQQHHQQQQQHHQQQQPHNFFSINHMGAGHEQELPEQQQTFQSRLHQSHQQQQQLQQHNFLSQPNPVRPLPVREQEHMFQHREQEHLFQPQVQPFQVTSPPHQQNRPSPQPPQQQSHIQSPPATPQSPFSWPQASQLSQPQQQKQQSQQPQSQFQQQLQHQQIKQEQQHQQQIKQEQQLKHEQQLKQQMKQEQQKQQQLKQQQLQQEQLKQQQLQQEKLKQQQLQEEQRKQQQLQQEQLKQQQLQEEKRKQQQLLEEQRKQQQLLEEQRKQQQLLEEQRKQQQLLEEQRKQQQLQEEQRKQQLLLEEQLKQQQLLEEQRKQQQVLEEQRKQQQLLEEQRKQQKLLEEQRKQQQLQEEQRKQHQLQEEQRKQQQLQEEQRKQQQLQEEQLKQQQLQEEQRKQQEQQHQESLKQNAAPVQLPGQVNSNNGVREEETETEAEAEPVDVSPTFWTACPYCFYMYEYPRVYVECTLRCDNCKRAFQAVPISSPPPIIEGQDAYFYCWGFFPLGLSMSHLQGNNNKGTNSNWTPFSSLHNTSNNVQNHLNEQAAPKENLFVNKSSGPRIYIDDITDDVFIGVSEPGSDSDCEWKVTKKQKLKRMDKGVKERIQDFKERIQVLALRAMYTRNGGVKNLKHGIPVQERVEVPTVLVVETNKKNVGSNPRKQSGRVAQEMGKLDLNVEFNNNEGEETAPRMAAGIRQHKPGEEDNIEGIEFFEGLDEYLSSLPILSVVNEEKVKVA